jgi:hypothetical protein
MVIGAEFLATAVSRKMPPHPSGRRPHACMWATGAGGSALRCTARTTSQIRRVCTKSYPLVHDLLTSPQTCQPRSSSSSIRTLDDDETTTQRASGILERWLGVSGARSNWKPINPSCMQTRKELNASLFRQLKFSAPNPFQAGSKIASNFNSDDPPCC